MPDHVKCNLCGRELAVHESCVVKMEVFADPSMPPLSADEVANASFDETLTQLLDQMKDMTAEELQNSVHRRFEFRLCGTCQKKFLANPLGKPRGIFVAQN